LDRPSNDGYVVFLETPADVPPIDPDEILHNPIHGPNIRSPALDDDGGSMLNMAGNRVTSLEMFSFGSTPLSASIEEFELT
jgi:hypothetical protein